MINIIIKWALSALAVIAVSHIVPGVKVANFYAALWVALTIGVINVFIKPLILLITLPINMLTFGLFSLVINAFLLMLAGNLVTGFNVSNFWSAFWGSIVLSIFTMIIDGVF